MCVHACACTVCIMFMFTPDVNAECPPQSLSTLLLMQDLSLSLELTDLTPLASESPGPSVSGSPELRSQTYVIRPHF